MTAAELKRAKELCEAATGGEWSVSDADKFSAIVIESSGRDVCTLDTYAHRPDECSDDAQFIAASRTLLPTAIAEIERLRSLAIEACDLAKWLTNDNDDSECPVCGGSLIERDHAMGKCDGPIDRLIAIRATISGAK